MKLRVALAQVNPTVGDLVGNAALIKDGVAAAAAQGAQIAIIVLRTITPWRVAEYRRQSSGDGKAWLPL